MEDGPSPVRMTTEQPTPPASEQILFRDSVTGDLGVITQRPKDRLFIFTPTGDRPCVPVDEPGRFTRAVLPVAPDHMASSGPEVAPQTAGQRGAQRVSRRQRDRKRRRRHRKSR
jgi:hypothetical protein